ncbi:MAG: YfcE family phosphodiesterase [Ruminococcaceae bacterium]|nr:YfcE family phosphodiesterase [Oscillospiraceae bacterium]
MKILVFSDSHGNPGAMFRAVKDHIAHGGVDMILHLGDGYGDFKALVGMFPDIPAYMVLGNCDDPYVKDAPKERIIEAEGFTFLMVHGHTRGVKRDLGQAADAAARCGADVLLYGHTHLAMDQRMDTRFGKTVRMINPGTVGSGYKPSYAFLEIVSGQLMCGFGNPTV